MRRFVVDFFILYFLQYVLQVPAIYMHTPLCTRVFTCIYENMRTIAIYAGYYVFVFTGKYCD